jgi:putative transposase
MHLRYSYRLDPTESQREALARAFGSARVVFNDALAARQAAYQAGEPYINDAVMSARLTAAKGTPDRAWLGDVSSVVLQQALADLNAAYRNFFASFVVETMPRGTSPPWDAGRRKTPVEAR